MGLFYSKFIIYNIVAKLATALLYRLNVPKEEVNQVVGQREEKNMPLVMFGKNEHLFQFAQIAKKERIKDLIEYEQQLGETQEEVLAKLQEYFDVSTDEASQYMLEFWK